ncbi:MAG: hypothetical protein OFPII_19980 [Osedax symbiont Rs1]|nr:MAG: hypothetical protein OFPII_19980 [Osedax symbiont Rs1]
MPLLQNSPKAAQPNIVKKAATERRIKLLIAKFYQLSSKNKVIARMPIVQDVEYLSIDVWSFQRATPSRPVQ